jgi:hypothetical protein
MKHLLHAGFLAIVLFCYAHSYAQQVTKAKTKEGATKVKGQGAQKDKSIGRESLDMRGAYSMLHQVVNDGTKDSVMANEQMKLFTDQHVMYARKRSGDSLAAFGIGTYKVENGKVIEHMFYTADNGARRDTFELKINKTDDGYSQVIEFPEEQGIRYILTEDYKTVGKNVTSPLDGAWKQTKNVYIPKNGEAVTNENPIQYKVFQSGHFMWGNTVMDSATQKPVSFFGYGTFERKGNNQIIEVNTNSSYASLLVGRPVTIDIKFIGKDQYQQTFVWEDGSKNIEYYERLKE